MAFFKGMMGAVAGVLGWQTVKDYDAADMLNIALGALQSKSKELQHRPSSDPEVQALAKQISEMQRWLQRDRQQLTIVTRESKGGWTTLTILVLGATGALVYLRFWRGWRFSDMMYVTRGGMQTFRTQVAEAIKSVKENVERSMAVVGEKLSLLQRKQDDLVKGQRELSEQVDSRLDDVKGDITQVHGDVRLLQTEISDVRQRIQVGNQGLFVLIQAVSEMMPAVGFRNNSTQHHLQAYLKEAPALLGLQPLPAARAPQGLECLSDSSHSSSAAALLFPAAPASTRGLLGGWGAAALDDASSANTSASGRNRSASLLAAAAAPSDSNGSPSSQHTDAAARATRAMSMV